MIQTTPSCTTCGSFNMIKHGRNKSGHPQYKGKECNACRVLKPYNKGVEVDEAAVCSAYEERAHCFFDGTKL